MSETAPSMRKIGELADASGVTVRTLHYYEEIGLLNPSERTDAGHRLYGPGEVERLYRICLLRQLGIPLDGVRASLDREGAHLGTVIGSHLAELDRRLEAENRLRARLARLVGTIGIHGEPTLEILDVLEDMSMLQNNINKPISVLVCADIERQFNFLTEVFGLGPGEIMRDPDGNVVHGEIEVGSGTIWLHLEAPEFDLASPASIGKSTTTMVALVDDVDGHHAYSKDRGANVRYEPCDQPYGYREYGVLDSEGHLWSFMKALEGS